MSDALTPGATARLLGVAPSTLRSWDHRYGIGPRERSPGGHRRYSPSDVARLRELCRLVGEGLPPASAARLALDRGPSVPAPRGEGQGSAGSADAAAGPARVGSARGQGDGGRRAGPTGPAPRPGGDTLPLGHAVPTLQGIARAAMRLDADLVESLLEEALLHHGVVAAWEELAMPLLYGMGRKWEDTLRYVEVEHLLSWCVSSALRRVPPPCRARAPGGSGTGPATETDPGSGSGTGTDPGTWTSARPTVLACGPHEMHGLPVEALAAALRERGVPHRMLGPCTPVEATVRTVRRIGPRAVVLWCHAGDPADAAALRGTVRAVAESPQSTAVYTAGPGWRSVNGGAVLADAHLNSLADAVRVLATG
ncbi:MULTISPECIES: MerR family transcriptional regulator [Nocardiopsidaceae]|uniref:MerR family transcriptional regulator n=1 Tax=Streptomonospora nanhaiensis TaxID=1323731 RepID=A0ABY6YQR1_9ACTN|nr:MerR family transcriptional regulator [Streptomonospora nanhaiensis]WAE74693.1 MerR family transcriptional regulator [Streptomonospora nanhaiensis]